RIAGTFAPATRRASRSEAGPLIRPPDEPVQPKKSGAARLGGPGGGDSCRGAVAGGDRLRLRRPCDAVVFVVCGSAAGDPVRHYHHRNAVAYRAAGIVARNAAGPAAAARARQFGWVAFGPYRLSLRRSGPGSRTGRRNDPRLCPATRMAALP